MVRVMLRVRAVGGAAQVCSSGYRLFNRRHHCKLGETPLFCGMGLQLHNPTTPAWLLARTPAFVAADRVEPVPWTPN